MTNEKEKYRNVLEVYQKNEMGIKLILYKANKAVILIHFLGIKCISAQRHANLIPGTHLVLATFHDPGGQPFLELQRTHLQGSSI